MIVTCVIYHVFEQYRFRQFARLYSAVRRSWNVLTIPVEGKEKYLVTPSARNRIVTLVDARLIVTRPHVAHYIAQLYIFLTDTPTLLPTRGGFGKRTGTCSFFGD